ncbi:MAG TPA: hypothetical protein VFV18_04135 [Porticoccaceae bacterium]|nr:hypothetical protein [Porticoccaceae bacterium]
MQSAPAASCAAFDQSFDNCIRIALTPAWGASLRSKFSCKKKAHFGHAEVGCIALIDRENRVSRRAGAIASIRHLNGLAVIVPDQQETCGNRASVNPANAQVPMVL